MATNLPDVNVLVYAHRADSEHHGSALAWLEEALSSGDPFLLLDTVIVGFLRLVTDARVYRPPTPLPDAVEAVEQILAWPTATRVMPGASLMPTLLAIAPRAHGPDLPDAYLAAAAVELEARVVSYDSDFRKFSGLRWITPGS